MNFDDAASVRTLGLIAAGSLFWLQYWDLKDRWRPEPRARLAAAFGLGAVAAGVAWLLYLAAAAAGVPTHPGSDPARVLLVSLAVVGPIEEAAKLGVALAVVFRWKSFDEHADGVVYAAALSLGFAAAENLLWLPSLGTRDAVVRALCSPLVHTLFGALWGYGVARALLKPRSAAGRLAWIVGSYVVAAFAHGVYDSVLGIVESPLAAAGVVLVLWCVVIGLARLAAFRDSAPTTPRA